MVEGTGRHRKRYSGHFIDLKTLTYALTGESHSLASAAKALKTAHEKTSGDYAGPITCAYIGYNRRDVLVTLELLEALRGEFDLPHRAHTHTHVRMAHGAVAARARLHDGRRAGSQDRVG